MTGNYRETERTVPFGPFNLNFEKNQCILPNGDVKLLSHGEMHVLVRLSDVRFRSKEDIALSVAAEVYPKVKDLTSVVKEESVLVHVRSLRAKLGDHYITTNRGHGYMLNFK